MSAMRIRAQAPLAQCRGALPVARITPRAAAAPRVAHIQPALQHSLFHGVPVAQGLSASFVSRPNVPGRAFRLQVQAAAKKSVGDLSKQDLEGKTVFVSSSCLKATLLRLLESLEGFMGVSVVKTYPRSFRPD